MAEDKFEYKKTTFRVVFFVIIIHFIKKGAEYLLNTISTFHGFYGGD